MREISAESDRHLAKARELQPRYPSVAVGAADFDEWVIGESLAVLLRTMSDGRSVGDSLIKAVSYSVYAIQLHNEKRPKDVNWQRHASFCESALNYAATRLRAAEERQ